jgi:hypothetical protein
VIATTQSAKMIHVTFTSMYISVHPLMSRAVVGLLPAVLCV